MNTFISLLGMAVLIGIGFALSNNRKSINVRTVLGAFLILIFSRWHRSLCARRKGGLEYTFEPGLKRDQLLKRRHQFYSGRIGQ